MKTFADQLHLAEHVDTRLREQLRRSEDLTRSLSAEQRRRPRRDGGWSVEEILGHLARVNQLYLGQLKNIRLDDAKVACNSQGWKPTLGGRLLRWSMHVQFPVKTPGAFRPERTPSTGDALAAFTASQIDVLDELARLQRFDLSNLRCASPVTRLLQMNVGDVFLVIVDHSDRHMQQLERQYREVREERPSSGMA